VSLDQVATETTGRAGRPPPASSAPLWLLLSSWGYWPKSNGLWSGQRPGGRRHGWPVSWGFPRLGAASGGDSGARSGTSLRCRRSQAWGWVSPRLSECSNLCLWPVPPAGFEPALTAPEANAVW